MYAQATYTVYGAERLRVGESGDGGDEVVARPTVDRHGDAERRARGQQRDLARGAAEIGRRVQRQAIERRLSRSPQPERRTPAAAPPTP